MCVLHQHSRDPLRLLRADRGELEVARWKRWLCRFEDRGERSCTPRGAVPDDGDKVAGVAIQAREQRTGRTSIGM